jgi:tetratricopeptide (TPR) repeat protein
MYAVNLHAAKVAKLAEQNLFGFLNEDRFPDAIRVLAEGQDALSSVKEPAPGDEAVIRLNNVLLLLAMKQPARALETLEDVPRERPRDAVFAYKAVALARLGQFLEARGILQAGEQQLGKTPLLEASLKHIESSKPYAGAVNALSDPESVASIVTAFAALARLDAEDQARALGAGSGTLGDYLLVQVREAAAALVELRSTMRGLDMTSKEDDISAMLKEILGARLRHVNWSVRDQERGGYTGTGNPGERDLSIKKDTGLLSLIEAVVTRSPTTNQFILGELKSHLEKLIAYGTCSVYFHVTYEMSGDDRVIEHLRKISEEFSLNGVAFVEHQEITFDTGPRGFSALYQTAAGPRKMHFLVLDFHQGVLKEAATMSAASNLRNAKASAKRKPRKAAKEKIV